MWQTAGGRIKGKHTIAVATTIENDGIVSVGHPVF